jgi:thiol-disulfide isomerase/thioredoxin
LGSAPSATGPASTLVLPRTDMAVQILNRENFVEVVSRTGITLVDCCAEWCAPCKVFSPIFQRAAEKHPQHAFGTLDTHEEREIADKLEIKHIPTLLLYRDGLLLLHEPASLDAAHLDQIVEQAEALDMDEVRAAIARERARAEED